MRVQEAAELARVRGERDEALAKWREAEDDGREAEARVLHLEAALRDIERVENLNSGRVAQWMRDRAHAALAEADE